VYVGTTILLLKLIT